MANQPNARAPLLPSPGPGYEEPRLAGVDSNRFQPSLSNHLPGILFAGQSGAHHPSLRGAFVARSRSLRLYSRDPNIQNALWGLGLRHWTMVIARDERQFWSLAKCSTPFNLLASAPRCGLASLGPPSEGLETRRLGSGCSTQSSLKLPIYPTTAVAAVATEPAFVEVLAYVAGRESRLSRRARRAFEPWLMASLRTALCLGALNNWRLTALGRKKNWCRSRNQPVQASQGTCSTKSISSTRRSPTSCPSTLGRWRAT